jgi:hypothetical protein
MTAQQEMVKQLVAALEDVGRGRASGLTNLLAEFSEHAAGRPSREDHARIKAEVSPRVVKLTWHLCLPYSNENAIALSQPYFLFCKSYTHF